MIRQTLIDVALDWQERSGVAPQITSTVSEFDAAMFAGMSEAEYSAFMQDKTAVCRGSDFKFNGIRYQVKGNQPSGKIGSIITNVPKARNYHWNRLLGTRYEKVDDSFSKGDFIAFPEDTSSNPHANRYA